jgi:hypothetical protein
MNTCDYVADWGGTAGDLNPMLPMDWEDYLGDASAIIVERIDYDSHTGRGPDHMVIVTDGDIPEDWRIGAVWCVKDYYDPDLLFGVYEVVGEVEYDQFINEEEDCETTIVKRATGLTDITLPYACFK